MLALGRHGQGLQAVAVDLALPIGLTDTRQQIGDCQPTLDHDLGYGKGRGDLDDGAAFLQKPVESLKLIHLVHGKARHILDEGCFDGVDIVALRHDGTG